MRHSMIRLVIHTVVAVVLTITTQIGGIAWLFAAFFRRKLLVFVVAYVALMLASTWTAPLFGRVALSCLDGGPLQVQSWLYCALNRNYVSADLKAVLIDTANEMDQQFPGTVTLVLDANFPFFDGFPLFPHLSHDDGEKVDVAFFYRDETGYLPKATRSPIGYFAFEQGPTQCSQSWPTLRWDLNAMQALWPAFILDKDRNKVILQILSRDERVGKIFVEPHVVQTLNAAHPKIRFQGCNAARHDDHIHLQLR